MREEQKERLLKLTALARATDQDLNPEVQRMIKSLSIRFNDVKAKHLARFLNCKKARKMTMNIPFASYVRQGSDDDFLIGELVG